MTDMGFGGKVAIVTGGARGLGFAIAEALAAAGAKVLVGDVSGAEDAVHQLSSTGSDVKGCFADVTSEDSVRAMVEAAQASFGRVDILVNNAAIAADMAMTRFEDISPKAFLRMMEVNALGTFLCCQAVSPIMRAQRYGRIINMASGTAFRGMPFVSHYVASKGAVMTLTRSLAHELGEDEITVNAVSPGYTITGPNMANESYMQKVRPEVLKLRAIKRDAYADDVVGAVLFLASDGAKFVTGQILAADGGAVYH
ncbi:glucose 1-dehydrogenase [Novosphingobium sp.]|uniref:SDR family NAD(P)-dependent oxidoreductase n=1 Tax=Novosphingobium sp. TaxID=1874826 RepID=UPI002B48E117|nr:glucose 1-dehydrogenase [Novosphingobium sp.]HKR91761.1 glucose 1-dehydrogenase [Novosphingobium sp.]